MSSLFSDLHSEDEIAERFSVTVRVVREHAWEKGLGLKIGKQKRWFTEAEALALWEKDSTCSNSQNGTGRRTGTRAGRTSQSTLSKALARSTERKRKDSSPSCNTKSLREKRVVPFGPRKDSHLRR